MVLVWVGGLALINRFSVSSILFAACIAAAGCNPAATPPPPAKVEAPAPFVAMEGEIKTIAPLSQEDQDPSAFGVVQFNALPDMSKIASVRMFGTAGSDPAANGLLTYLSFASPHDGRGFLLGNFREYRVINASPGRIDLEIDEDVMSEAGELKLITRRVIVSWTEKPQENAPNPEYPASLTITPAQ